MRKIVLIPLLIMSLFSSSASGEDLSELLFREGFYYQKFSDTPFTGEVTGQFKGLFENGVKVGLWETYRSDGSLLEKGYYVDGKQVGSWLIYSDEGKVRSTSNFEVGIRISYESYQKDGSVSFECKVVNSALDNFCTAYHDNGTVSEQGLLIDGKKEGPWIGYYPSGSLWMKGTYRNDKKDGLWEGYYHDGEVNKEFTGFFIDGEKFSD
jgi:antitoxin component YwqK of YwqJK toxin-antitoxin module